MSSIEKIIKRLFVILFLIILTTVPIFSFVDEDREISDIENRRLAQFPKINKKELLSGKFFSKLEQYFADQMYGRDAEMNLYSLIQSNILNKNKVNNIVLGKEGYLLPYRNDNIGEISESSYDSYGDNIVDTLVELKNITKGYNGELVYLYMPHKKDMYYDMYPKYYENGHEYYLKTQKIKMSKIRNAGINAVDASDVLEKAKKNNDYIYYKTDHHYTFKGAYYCYQELLKTLRQKHPEWSLTYPQWKSMDLIRVDKKFIGSYLKHTGNLNDNRGDYFEYALPNNFPKFEKFENGKKRSSTLFADKKYSGDIVGYEYVLNNIPNLVIKTYREELPNILFVGYSYTNPLEAMAVYNFNEMHSIDPRYWKGNISEYIKNTKPDIVVVVRDDLYQGNKENISIIE